MKQGKYLVQDAIADTSTQKFLEKIPSFPAEVLIINLNIPPTAQDYLPFDYSGARTIIELLLSQVEVQTLTNNRCAFLIEFEQKPYYTDLVMDIRIVITGEVSDKIIKKLKRNCEGKMMTHLGISADFEQYSEISEEQLIEMMRPLMPSTTSSHQMEHLKIMNRLYQLDFSDLIEKQSKKS
jgi:hypothetical protein